jgi:hypothetical protein
MPREDKKENKRKNPRKGAGDQTSGRARRRTDSAQDSEYANLLNRVERSKDSAEIKKIAARIERENP